MAVSRVRARSAGNSSYAGSMGGADGLGPDNLGATPAARLDHGECGRYSRKAGDRCPRRHPLIKCLRPSDPSGSTPIHCLRDPIAQARLIPRTAMFNCPLPVNSSDWAVLVNDGLDCRRSWTS
jgi:hypothetical protein